MSTTTAATVTMLMSAMIGIHGIVNGVAADGHVHHDDNDDYNDDDDDDDCYKSLFF